MKKFFSAVLIPSAFDGMLLLIYFLCAADLMYSFVFVSGGLVSEKNDFLPYAGRNSLSVALSAVLTIFFLGILRIALGMKEPRNRKVIAFFLGIIMIFYSAVTLVFFYSAVYSFFAFG